ncbi:M23 family metallopeptidase [Sneathiella aquimaris]|uniref:M23 family metallopeptidase n=1 Tax=Sneathiella aquimaris TaxID=2599305 RepID=UPI00146A350E|nr:M23 family metallopeptidase [Sneathiella aquimaris]
MRFVSIPALLPILLILPLTVLAQQKSPPPELGLPVKCRLGENCFVQHYIDTDPTKNAADYQCGSLTYDNHRGTDIRIRTLADMAKGVPVIASADGVVTGLRDNIRDQYFSDYSKPQRRSVFEKGLGNVVVLGHGNGWTTFYAHLKKNSITVKKNQRVKKGTVLGYVGMSGVTDFPHVHFELRHNNKRIDPFTGNAIKSGCGPSEQNYWDDLTRVSLAYQQTGFLYTGLSETRPNGRKDLEKGVRKQESLNSAAPTLFFWSYYFGSRKDDIVTLVLKGPDGQILADYRSDPMPKNQISRNFYIGKKKPAGGWPAGLYQGEISITRNGKHLTDRAFISVK